MSRRNSDSNFLVQGSILAAASIVSRIIGLFYRIPLTAIIGDQGNDYYSCAYEIYSMLLLISSYSLPMAVSKMVSIRVAASEQKNAMRVFRSAVIFALVTGTAGCLIVFFGANVLTAIFQTPQSYFSLRVLAPALIIVAVLGVLRGFFQGHGTTVPSAISQVLEQIVNAAVSVGAAFLLFSYGKRVAAVLSSDVNFAGAFGAAGGTLGTSTGALIGLIFILLVFFTWRRKIARIIRVEDKQAEVKKEPYRQIYGILIMTIVPILLSTTIYNLTTIVDQGFFKNIAIAQGYAPSDVSTWWGIFAGKYRVLVNVPISIASAIAASAVPAISGAFSQKRHIKVQKQIGLALRFVLIIAMPCTAGLIVLADPVIQMLYPGSDPLAARLMIVGGISVIFYSISTLSNAVLQGIDRMRVPIRNAVISLAVHMAAILVAMLAFNLNIYAVSVGIIVFSLCMCILNSRSVHRYSGFSPDLTKTFIKPAVSALIMAVAVHAFYRAAYGAMGHGAICTLAGIVVGIIVYAIVLLLVRAVSEEELKSFPKGDLIASVAKKCRLLK